MSGPAYPNPNPPGSNAIGSFAIGVSPLGDVPSFDVWQTILAQYANSPILDGIITSFNAAMDMTEPLDDFYDLVWNVATAEGYGLDVWGRIVGVSRVLQFPSGSTFFGFEEAGSSWTGFGQGGFFSGGTTTNNFSLSDFDFRKLILAKAASNVCDGSIPAINAILLALFAGRGKTFVVDGLNMQLNYTFEFTLNPIEVAIVQLSGVLPEPAGVVINISSL